MSGCRPSRRAKYLYSKGKPARELVQRGDGNKVAGSQGSAERGGRLLSQGLHARRKEWKGLPLELWSVKWQRGQTPKQKYMHCPRFLSNSYACAASPKFRCTDATGGIEKFLVKAGQELIVDTGDIRTQSTSCHAPLEWTFMSIATECGQGKRLTLNRRARCCVRGFAAL
jgi:hypothetical protein